MENIKNKGVENTDRVFNWQSTTEDVLKGINLSGKTALVTGASSGIPHICAHLLATIKVILKRLHCIQNLFTEVFPLRKKTVVPE